jgi:hypothetical protein
MDTAPQPKATHSTTDGLLAAHERARTCTWLRKQDRKTRLGNTSFKQGTQDLLTLLHSCTPSLKRSGESSILQSDNPEATKSKAAGSAWRASPQSHARQLSGASRHLARLAHALCEALRNQVRNGLDGHHGVDACARAPERAQPRCADRERPRSGQPLHALCHGRQCLLRVSIQACTRSGPARAAAGLAAGCTQRAAPHRWASAARSRRRRTARPPARTGPADQPRWWRGRRPWPPCPSGARRRRSCGRAGCLRGAGEAGCVQRERHKVRRACLHASRMRRCGWRSAESAYACGLCP